MALNTVFEKEVCGRCGGTGRFSFNQIDGDRCFGCGGKGEKLTKRGKAAARFFRDMRCVPIEQVKVGDRVEVSSFTVGGAGFRYFAEVVKVSEPCRGGSIMVGGEWREFQNAGFHTEHPKYGKNGLFAAVGSPVLRALSVDEHNARLQEALAYQASLTKAGEPRKRKGE